MRPSTMGIVPLPGTSVVKVGAVGWASGWFAELSICGSTDQQGLRAPSGVCRLVDTQAPFRACLRIDKAQGSAPSAMGVAESPQSAQGTFFARSSFIFVNFHFRQRLALPPRSRMLAY